MKKFNIFLICILLLFSNSVVADQYCGEIAKISVIRDQYWEDIPGGLDMWPIEYKKYCFKECQFRLFSIICYKKRRDC